MAMEEFARGIMLMVWERVSVIVDVPVERGRVWRPEWASGEMLTDFADIRPDGEVVDILMVEDGLGICHPGILMPNSNGALESTVYVNALLNG